MYSKTAKSIGDIQWKDELEFIENLEKVEYERIITTNRYDDIMRSSYSTALSSSPFLLPINLSKIDLPKFGGRIEMWVTLENAFNIPINGILKLSEIKELLYLRRLLFGKIDMAIGR